MHANALYTEMMYFPMRIPGERRIVDTEISATYVDNKLNFTGIT